MRILRIFVGCQKYYYYCPKIALFPAPIYTHMPKLACFIKTTTQPTYLPPTPLNLTVSSFTTTLDCLLGWLIYCWLGYLAACLVGCLHSSTAYVIQSHLPTSTIQSAHKLTRDHTAPPVLQESVLNWA